MTGNANTPADFLNPRQERLSRAESAWAREIESRILIRHYDLDPRTFSRTRTTDAEGEWRDPSDSRKPERAVR